MSRRPGRGTGTNAHLPFLARLRVGTKLMILVMLPAGVLLAVAVFSGVADLHRATELRDFRTATRLSFATARLANALADERAATAVVRLQPSEQARVALTAARHGTDEVLRETAANAASSRVPIDVTGQVASARLQLQALRVQVDAGSDPLPTTAERYGVIIRNLLGTVGRLDAGRPTQSSGRATDAYVALLQANEAADRERIDVATVLSEPVPRRSLTAITGRALETAELDTFRQNASGNLRAELDALLFSPAGARVQQLRTDLVSDPRRATTELSLQEWLAASGSRLHALRNLEGDSLGELQAAVSHGLDAARTASLRDLLVSIAVLFAVTILALALRRSIREPLLELSAAARMLSHGDLTADVHYAGRDEIGDMAAAFRDLHATAEHVSDEVRAMNTAIVENRLDHRADEHAFEGTWAQLLGGMNDTVAAFAQLQDRHRQAERQFEDVFKLSPDLLCIAGADGYFKRVNPAFEATLGYSSEELLSRPFLDFVHPDDRALTGETHVVAGGNQIVQFENRYLRKDGSVRWLQWNSRPVPEEGLVYAAARDVTDSRRAGGEQSTLRRLATLVARGVPATEVFNAVTAEMRDLMGADLTRLLRYEADGTATVLAVRAGPGVEPPTETRLTLEGHSVASSVLHTGRPARMETFEDAPPSIAELGEHGLHSRVGAPIVVEGRVWGAIVAAWREQGISLDTEGNMAEFTELVATAIANADSRSQLAASRARVVAAADETRRVIERDLHDGVQQRLVTVGLQLRAVEDAVPDELTDVVQGLERVEQGLTGALDDLREISRGIHPAILSRGGLVAALKTLARRAAVPVELDLDAEVRLPGRVEAAAYYVVAEALTNVAKHAQASFVQIKLTVDDSTVELVIRDDGIGGASPTRGSGLIGLTDRVEAIGGRISVDSPTGGGTSVLVRIPLAPTGEQLHDPDVV